MKCEICNKTNATVHVTEIAKKASADSAVLEKHVCESCARTLGLPSVPVVISTKSSPEIPPEILKLLRQSAQKARVNGSLACPHCGMSLAEFRSKGRFGCPRDYEVFQAHIEPLLLRVHNSKVHRGRTPGMDEGARKHMQQLYELRSQLETAIRDEAYESAAKLRDEIQDLETRSEAH